MDLYETDFDPNIVVIIKATCYKTMNPNSSIYNKHYYWIVMFRNLLDKNMFIDSAYIFSQQEYGEDVVWSVTIFFQMLAKHAVLN